MQRCDYPAGQYDIDGSTTLYNRSGRRAQCVDESGWICQSSRGPTARIYSPIWKPRQCRCLIHPRDLASPECFDGRLDKPDFNAHHFFRKFCRLESDIAGIAIATNTVISLLLPRISAGSAGLIPFSLSAPDQSQFAHHFVSLNAWDNAPCVSGSSPDSMTQAVSTTNFHFADLVQSPLRRKFDGGSSHPRIKRPVPAPCRAGHGSQNAVRFSIRIEPVEYKYSLCIDAIHRGSH